MAIRIRASAAWRPLLSASLLASTALGSAALGSAALAGPALPTGGKVAAGSAVIGAPTASALTVDQASSKAIIDWNSFSIGAGGAVQFNNGAGATLNRVSGPSVSSLDGRLGATGSVYLINPNGVIIGKSGVVDVGGTFVASTLDTPNAAFLAGGALTFSGASKAALINYGKVGALGGDVALIAARVENDGALSAAKGTAGLVSGYAVRLNDSSLDGGRFSVLVGGRDTSVTNAGSIAGVNAELRAEQGNIYALAGDTTGVIRATGVATGGGHVLLVADQGALTVNGVVEAKGADGSGGAVETSGASVRLDGAKIATGKGGSWLIDPVTLTIDQAAASAISTGLATANVTVQTTATGASGPGVQTAGAGDIVLASPINWASTNGLTLSAYRNVAIAANLADTQAGKLTLAADNGATGVGTVAFGVGSTASIQNGQVNIFYNPVSYTDPATRSTQTYTGGNTPDSTANPYTNFVTGGATLSAYMLVNSLAQLQAINTRLDGVYALNADINAASTATTPFTLLADGTSAATHFTGALNGQGHVIDALTISAVANDVGLFGFIDSGGSVSNLGLTHVSITGLAGVRNGSNVGGDTVGAVAGYAFGTMDNVYATGSVTGHSQVGGLVGAGYVSISNSHSDATVTGSSGVIGGLIGEGDGAYTNDYATGAISSQSGYSGGLVGYLFGTIANSHATGAVTDASGFGGAVGGLVGRVSSQGNGVVLDSYATGAVTGGYTYTGGLFGIVTCSGGSGCGIARVYATGAVTGGPNENIVGGLIGYATNASITNAYAGGAVTTTGQYAGGLIGYDYGVSVANAYATGAVSGTSNVGGLVGKLLNTATLTGVYATGAVTATGGAGSAIGGLVGSGDGSGSVSNAYWDTGTTGQTTAVGGTTAVPQTNVTAIGGTTGLDPYAASTYTNFDLTPTGAWYSLGATLTNSDGSLRAPSSYLGGRLRPMLRFEYSTTITNGHQLELMELNRGATYTLGANIDLSQTQDASEVWKPSEGFFPVGYLAQQGQTAVGFYGTLNGAGHTISNLTISQPTNYGVALISQLDASGLVENVTLSGGSVLGDDIVGALVGASAGRVQNATSTVAVNGSENVGGLVGYNAATGVVTGSSSAGPVTGIGSGVTGARYFAIGGLVGINNGLIDASFATGTVTVPASLAAGSVGGLVGQNGGASVTVGTDTLYPDTGGPNAITNAYATGAVNAPGSGTVGGLAGITYTSLTGVYATGAVTGGTQVGGLLGYLPFIATLTNAHATGNVTGTGNSIGGLVGQDYGSMSGVNATGTVSGVQYVGGLVGVDGAAVTIANATATGAVSGTNSVGGLIGFNMGALQTVAASGSVSGQSNIGGLAGVSDGAGVAITAATASGAVTAPTTGSAGDNIGGLIGVLSGGALTASSATGAVTGQTYVGGLIGYSGFAIDNNNTTVYATISGSHAGGAVTGGTNVGGLAGYLAGGAVADSYATGAVGGQFDVGGLLGYAASGATVTGSAVGRTYASGAVTGTGSDIGGVAGANFGTMTLAFYSPTAGGVDGGTPSGGATDVGGLVGVNGGAISQAGSTGSVQGGNEVGGLAGSNVSGGTITTANAQGNVTGAGYVGGSVGRNYGALRSVTAYGAVSGGGGTGGLVGVNEAGSSINTAIVTGAVNGINGFGTGADVGGLVGANFGTVTIASVSGNVTGKDHTGGLIGYNSGNVFAASAGGAVIGLGYVGGLIGLNYASVGGSHATGSVRGTDYVGGLIGWNGSTGAVSAADAGGAVVANPDYVGDPSAPPGFYTNVGGGAYAGGLVGVNKGALSGVTTLASATATGVKDVGGLVGLNQGSIAHSASLAPVGGALYLGGLVGWNDTGATIRTSYATGAVTGSAGGQDAAGNDYVGGLVGVNFGSVADTYATGAVSGVQVVGGLIGTNMPGGASVSTSYSTGAVSASSGAVGTSFGVQAGAVTYVYGFPTFSGQSVASGYYNAGATGDGMALTPAEANGSAAYVGFDFTNTWRSDPNGRPTLRPPSM